MNKLLKSLFSLVLMIYIITIYGNEITIILRDVDLIFLPLVLLISFIQYALSAWRWCYIASKNHSMINYGDALKYYYIAGFINNILPTGIIGDIYRTLNIKINNKSSGNFIKSLQSVIFERLSGQIALIVTFIFSLQVFFIVNQKFLASIYLLILITVFSIIIKLLFFYQKKNKYLINFKYIFSGKRLYRHFLMSLIIVMTYITTYIVCAYSLNLNIDIVSFFVFAPIILLSMALPVSIGGWGVRETVALAISFLLGLSVSASVTVAIVYGLCNLLCSLPGIYFLFTRKTLKS